MAENTELSVTEEAANDYLVTFSKPYKFEGETYTELDLSALEDLTTAQICACDRQFERTGAVSAMKEMNVEYACIVAAAATGKPIEFFKGLPGKDGNKVKLRVSAYFFGQD